MTAVIDEESPARPGTEVEVARERASGMGLGRCDVPRELAQMLNLAEVLANAATMPKHLRRVEDVVLVMLAAQALDVPVFWAIQAFHLVEGRLGMEATFMRSLLYRAGGDFEPLEHTAQTATVRIRRPGAREWCKPVTVHHAEYKHLHGKNNWRDNPRAMLMARATTTGMRLYVPNVLMGFNYTPDELEEGAARPEITATVRPARAAASGSGAASGKAAWLAAVDRIRDLGELARLRNEAAEKGLLGEDLGGGQTLGDRITARAAALNAQANRAADDDVIDVEADEADDAEAEVDPDGVVDAFPDPVVPQVERLTCGCHPNIVFDTGNHEQGCQLYTPAAPAVDPRSRRGQR